MNRFWLKCGENDKYFLLLFSDPRIKSLTESKLGEFRTWFDQRLDDAIAAAEQQNGQLPPAVDGNLII